MQERNIEAELESMQKLWLEKDVTQDVGNNTEGPSNVEINALLNKAERRQNSREETNGRQVRREGRARI